MSIKPNDKSGYVENKWKMRSKENTKQTMKKCGTTNKALLPKGLPPRVQLEGDDTEMVLDEFEKTA